MRCVVLLCLILVALLPVNGDRKPKHYVIDIDEEPSSRWRQVAADFKSKISVLESILLDILPKSMMPLMTRTITRLQSRVDPEYVEEMKGFASGFDTSLAQLFMFNLIYDLSHLCTSIIAEDSNGNLVHGRNMDYAFSSRLRTFTIDVEFQRKSKMVYKATTFVGYIGIMTGMKPNAFTVTLNERFTSDGYWKNALILLLLESVKFTGFLVRETMEVAVDFEDAVHRLAYSKTVAPAYYIVGGISTGQAVVITKNDLKPDNFRYSDIQHNSWYVLQTNYDWWLPVPAKDDRRSFGVKYMDALGQSNVSSINIYNILSTAPILENDGTTIYTTLMSAAKPEMYRTVIRGSDNTIY